MGADSMLVADVLGTLLALLLMVGAEASAESLTTRIAQLIRIGTATFLLSIAFYLQVFAEASDTDGPEAENPIPLAFRWPPLALAIFILDRVRDNQLLPFEGEVLAILIYGTFVYLVWYSFFAVLDQYDVKRPRNRIPEFCREMIEGLRR
jgi:hypothetical protein